MNNPSSSPRKIVTMRRLLLGIGGVLCAVLLGFVLWGRGNFNLTGMTTANLNDTLQKVLFCGGIAILLAALITLWLWESSRDRDVVSRPHPVWFYPVLTGVLSLSCMVLAYSFIGMWPAGEKCAMIVDMHHQYAPLLSELRDMLLHGGNLLYTFKAGMGANFLSMFGYYMASPLNLLLVLFPENLLPESILFITLIKNMLTGAFFALALQYIYGKRSLRIPIISVMFSMMMYLIAYSWNIMWLDVVMMLPLVILAFERMMRTGKFLAYVLTLAYSLYANYYIGFMLCIFMTLYFIAYLAREPHSGRNIRTACFRFAGFSVLGGGLVMFLLIPVYFALKATSAAGSALPVLNTNFALFDLLGRHLINTSPTIRSGNLPNIYCGVLAVVLVPLFATLKEIPLRRRLTYLGLLGVLAFSFTFNNLDLLWHGLHAPNDLPYRFSFFYSFVLLLIGYETLLHLKTLHLKAIGATSAGVFAYIIIEERFGGDDYDLYSLYISLAVVLLYAGVLALAASGKVRERVACAFLLLTVTAEMLFNGGVSFIALSENEFYTEHDSYVDNATTTAVSAAVKSTQSLAAKETNGTFYRMELLPRRTCVDTALFHYQGITTFSSSNYYKTTRLMGSLGYAINGVNSSLYHSFVPFTDSLLGIRYVLLSSEIGSHRQLSLRQTVTTDDVPYYVYENKDALSLGFVTSKDVKDWTYSFYDPIYTQNSLLTATTGIEKDLYTLHPIRADDDETPMPEDPEYVDTSFSVTASGEDQTGNFHATVNDGGQLFLYVDCRAADNMTISLGESSWTVTAYEPYLIDGGTLSKLTTNEDGTTTETVVPPVTTAAAVGGTDALTQANMDTSSTDDTEKHTVHLSVTSKDSCTGNFYVATMNQDVYTEAMEKLSANQMQVTSYTDSHIEGKVSSSTAGTLFTSIPFDEGWTVTVDGKTVKTYAIGEGLLGFDIASGMHSVTFNYCPKGLLIGGGISVFCLLVLLAVCLITHKRRIPTSGKPEYVPLHDQSIPLPVIPLAPDRIVPLSEEEAEPPLPEGTEATDPLPSSLQDLLHEFLTPEEEDKEALPPDEPKE